MKYSEEISKLVIKNIEQHERASMVIEEIDKLLFKTIEEESKQIISDFKSELDGNEELDFADSEYLLFSFKDWLIKDIEGMQFGFSLHPTGEEEHEDTATWLGHLCGIPHTSSGLILSFWIDNKSLNLRLPRLKPILVKHLEKSEELKSHGFKLSKKGDELELHFNFSHDKICSHYPYELSEAMSPLVKVFKAIEKCKPELDKIVEAIKTESPKTD
ncbi:hypothetical protein EDB44_10415 [Vibrio crassostreae]|uniref:hypothetical protein n=1 Tax=Vibrio crassostreae TaxID=246167 RepID=UPI001042C344|nr:hypothetical protein [Vibrio crassostreae]TCT64715.1 hypothetical protein EDB44_10415 [Vibrio crassostreae]TCT84933.1 hypothetical protein EDB43_10415 [Vibrio crassostreae]